MILGIDEVGRGPWAGPLVVGAVILKDPTAKWCAPLTDSKKLTAKKREQLATEIHENAAATALGWVTSGELDLNGLRASLDLATRRAVNLILAKKVPFSEIIIDGTINFLADTPLKDHVTTLKKADLLIKEVSAASIIAKVARDRYMMDLAEIYPDYGFESHVGYGTAAHKRALAQFGPCPEHRHSFKPIAAFAAEGVTGKTSSRSIPTGASTTSTDKGKKAESVVADHLTSSDHRIIARNHKTKFYEIDIISVKNDTIYFTEVKYRSTKTQVNPLETITAKKQQQMSYAAESFLRYRRDLAHLNPKLAVASVSDQNFTFETWFPLDS